MSPLGARFADYPTRVAEYAVGHGSDQLDLAYELGRSVVETGSELLAALELHDRGTLDALPVLGEDAGTAQLFERAAEMRLHLLAPVAMAISGYLVTGEQWCGERAERGRIEEELRAVAFELARQRESLEGRVAERTRELALTYARLAREFERRGRAQEALRSSGQRERLAHERLVHAIESLGDGFALFDRDDRLVLCNARYREIHAAAAAILVPGTSYAAILRRSAEEGAFGPIDELDGWVAERASRRRVSHEPYGLQLASGPYLLVRSARTPEGEIVELLADVSSLKAGEAQLSRRNAQLGAINAELERYAYIVSHDLRSPLRGVRLIVDWIMEDAAETATGRLAEYLALLRTQVARFERMLDDLLHYSRLGHDAALAQEVDLDELLKETVRLLAPPDGFTVRSGGRLGRANGVEVELGLILRNTIDNAIKHHDRGRGLIQVETRRRRGELEIEIRDDGPGIPTQFHERVFEIFAKLRPRDEVEGSGLGLSMLRRLVQQRGGHVRLISNPPIRGTTLRIVLPQPVPDR
jgi:signal transduction histidine kinase